MQNTEIMYQQAGARTTETRGTVDSFPKCGFTYRGYKQENRLLTSSFKEQKIHVTQGQLLKCFGTRGSKTGMSCSFWGAADPPKTSLRTAGTTDNNSH